jgi:hypothetical protein
VLPRYSIFKTDLIKFCFAKPGFLLAYLTLVLLPYLLLIKINNTNTEGGWLAPGDGSWRKVLCSQGADDKCDKLFISDLDNFFREYSLTR